jgi:hypothetical protein
MSLSAGATIPPIIHIPPMVLHDRPPDPNKHPCVLVRTASDCSKPNTLIGTKSTAPTIGRQPEENGELHAIPS